MLDPGKYMRWMMSPMDAQTMNMLMQTLNPSMYLKWMMSPLDPRAMQLAMAPMNPALYTSWMGTSMNPATYGSWGTWLNPNTYAAPMTGGMSGAPGTFNFFDPNSWMGMTTPYGQPAAAPTAAAPATGAPAYVNRSIRTCSCRCSTRLLTPAGTRSCCTRSPAAPAK